MTIWTSIVSISRAERWHLLKTYHPIGHLRTTSVHQKHSKELGPAVTAMVSAGCFHRVWGQLWARLVVKLSGMGKWERIMKKAKGKRLQNLQQIFQSWVCMLISCPRLLLLISNNSSVTTPDLRNGELSDYVHVKCLAASACYIHNS